MIAVPRFDLLASGVLVATNATDAATYNAGTTYAKDATCAYAERTWRSLQAGNVGHTPDTEPLWWLDAGPLNTEAVAMYRRLGYVECGPFADYAANPYSLFMTRKLTGEPSNEG